MPLRILPLAALLMLAGCGQSLRVASPRFTKAPPMITCIVVVNSDADVQVAKAAIAACQQATLATMGEVAK